MSSGEQRKEVCSEIVKGVERRLKSGERRMDKHAETIDRLDRLIAELAALSKSQMGLIDSHEERLTSLEKQPSFMWDKVITGIISALVAALMATILGR